MRTTTFTPHDIEVAKALWHFNRNVGSYTLTQSIILDPDFQQSISKNCACALYGWIGSCFANAEGGPLEPVERYSIDDVSIEEKLKLSHELFKEMEKTNFEMHE